MANHKIPEKILNILRATPSKEKEPDLSFKMPKNEHLWSDFKILIRRFGNE